MHIEVQCAACGETLTIIAQQIYAGWYPCPVCLHCALYVGVSETTPNNVDPWDVENLSVVESSSGYSSLPSYQASTT